MVITKVSLKVRNVKNSSKFFEGEFLVDSGASFTVVPTSELKKMGIKPSREERFVLADGKVISRKVGSAMYEYKGIESAAPVLFGVKAIVCCLVFLHLRLLGYLLILLKDN